MFKQNQGIQALLFVYELFLSAAARTGATDTLLIGLGIVSVAIILETPAALTSLIAPFASTGGVQTTNIRFAPLFLQARAACAIVPPVLIMSSAKTTSLPVKSALPMSNSSLDDVCPSLRIRLFVKWVCSASSPFATVPAHCSASSSGATTIGFFGFKISRAYLPSDGMADKFFAGTLKTLDTSPSLCR